MALIRSFSRRKREAQGIVNDVYTYDDIPVKIRVQFVHLMTEAIGENHNRDYRVSAAEVYDEIVRVARKEEGVLQLTPKYYNNSRDEFSNWILGVADTDSALDGMETTLRLIDVYVRENYRLSFNGWAKVTPDEAIAEFNARFQEAGIGYEYTSGNLIQISDQIIHDEATIPALHLLSDRLFSTANSEFLAAHGAYRRGDFEMCIVGCGKSFESVLKIIGANLGWQIKETDPAKKLLDAAYAADFIPPYMQAEFSGLRSILEGGVPVVRNQRGGHGQGNSARTVPKHLASFQLNQTASAIVFLVEQYKTLP